MVKYIVITVLVLIGILDFFLIRAVSISEREQEEQSLS